MLWFLACAGTSVFGQQRWQLVDEAFGPLPAGVHVYRSNMPVDSAPFIAYYVDIDMNQRHLQATVDTASGRRLTPSQFYQKNNQPLVVVNATFFSFATNQNVNLVLKKKRILAHHPHSVAGKGKDTLTYAHPIGSAIGVKKNGQLDIAWTFTDTLKRRVYYINQPLPPSRDSSQKLTYKQFIARTKAASPKQWRMYHAIGGGPILVQDGQMRISNNEEMKFAGKGIRDKHPRTLFGYTSNGHLIVMAVQGRSTDAAGVTLEQAAKLLLDLGCIEGMNADGGGSSCLLVNGKPTIQVSDKEGQRPVPAVWMIQQK